MSRISRLIRCLVPCLLNPIPQRVPILTIRRILFQQTIIKIFQYRLTILRSLQTCDHRSRASSLPSSLPCRRPLDPTIWLRSRSSSPTRMKRLQIRSKLMIKSLRKTLKKHLSRRLSLLNLLKRLQSSQKLPPIRLRRIALPLQILQLW